MCRVQVLMSIIQFLCIRIPETLSHMILKRRAEMSADIYFYSSSGIFPFVLQWQ